MPSCAGLCSTRNHLGVCPACVAPRPFDEARDGLPPLDSVWDREREDEWHRVQLDELRDDQ